MSTVNNHVIYSRVSTSEQDAQQQSELLKKAYPQCKLVYEDHFTGSTLQRPELQAMIRTLKEGDSVYCYDVSRLGRNTTDVLAITEELKQLGVKIVIHTLGGVDITSTHGKMVLTVLASVATMQREEMLEKQAIGIQTAKAQGKYKGKQTNPETAIKCSKVQSAITSKDMKMTVPEALKAFDVGRATFYRWKKEQKTSK